MERMTDERLADIERLSTMPVNGGIAMFYPIGELLQALKAERRVCKFWKSEHTEANKRISELESRLAAVEKLPDEWRNGAMAARNPVCDFIEDICADELEEALK